MNAFVEASSIMGGSSSNEEKEIIISHAGNSGGTIPTSSETMFTLWEVTGQLVALLIMAITRFFIWRRCKKFIHKKEHFQEPQAPRTIEWTLICLLALKPPA